MERALSPVLIGREQQLSAVEDILRSASRARRIGFEVLSGACSEAELSLPYLPFVEAIGNYLAGADLVAMRERLGPSAREHGLVSGDMDRCLEGARFLKEVDEASTGLPWAADLAIEGFQAAGWPDEAKAMAEGFEKVPWLNDSPFVLRALARVDLADGNVDGAVTRAQAALDSFAANGYPLDAARTRVFIASAVGSAAPGVALEHLHGQPVSPSRWAPFPSCGRPRERFAA